jgi:4-hydroxy-3-methylbut-2-enyl diphosphate reductase
MKVTIDPDAGFCKGVKRAVTIAEEVLRKEKMLMCLGEIVHNDGEISRLETRGLKITRRESLAEASGRKVLIRAHGEPPSTFEEARKHHIEIVDATCPVVHKLQQKVKKAYLEIGPDGQVVIFGRPGHPEVEGLNGQANHRAIIIKDKDDLHGIDFGRPVRLFAQTTSDRDEYQAIAGMIKAGMKERVAGSINFISYDTICGQVSDRAGRLREFCRQHDVILFVSGRNSSNGKYLYGIARSVNERSYFISGADELKADWFRGAETVGITGATSTPVWLMKDIANKVSR